MFISVISPNRLPLLGQIGAFYFEIMNQSQVWMDLEPRNSEPGPNPVKVNFTVAFSGRKIENAPDVVEVRAESIDTAFPQRSRQPIMRFQLEDGTEVDMTAPGKMFKIYGGEGDNYPSYTVIVRMPFSDLHKIASSNSLRIEALGFTLDMKSEDIQSLRRYVQTVQNGVRLSLTQHGKLE